MQGTNEDPTTATLDFPRPYGVEQAERLRVVNMLTFDDPTYREALELTWFMRSTITQTRFADMTVAELVRAAAEAQRLFRAQVLRTPMNPEEVRRFWRAMRAAQLVMAFKARQRVGGPFHA